MMPSPIRAIGATFATSALASLAIAQQPQLNFTPHQLYRALPSQNVAWRLFGRIGDIYALLADLAPGSTPLFGQTFDLAFSPSVLVLQAGLVISTSPQGLTLSPSTFPAGTPLFFQLGEWDPSLGLGSMLASTLHDPGPSC